jgi:hypothetical protein
MKTLLCLAAVVLLAGCATQNHPPAVPELTKTISAPFDQVWGALVTELTGNYSFDIIDKNSGLIQTKQMAVARLANYAYEPSILLAVWSNTGATISVNVTRKGEAETEVRLIGRFEAYEFNVTKSRYAWPSNGELEKSILAGIEKRLAAPTAAVK